MPLQRQSPEQSILDLLDRGLRQPAELPLQLRGGDPLNLLQMEGAGPQEGLGQIQFPAVAAQGSRVEENRHQVKLVVSRCAREAGKVGACNATAQCAGQRHTGRWRRP